MTHRGSSRSSRSSWRVASRLASFVGSASVCVVLSGAGGCVQTGASLGQHCLKDDDCFSGHCAAQVCVPSAPELGADAAEGDSTLGSVEGSTTDDGPSGSGDGSPDGASPGDASVTGDADASAGDGATDAPSAPDAADGGGPVDANTPPDGSNDAPPDGPGSDAADDAPFDAPADAPSDAMLDVAAG